MTIVHRADGHFFEVDKKSLKKVDREMTIVCDGKGGFYEIDPAQLKEEVKTEQLPAEMRPTGAAARPPVGQPSLTHGGVCSVRG